LSSCHRFGGDAKGKGLTTLDFSINLIGSQPYQSGALFSYADDPTEIIIRVGVSFISTEQACANAELEVGTATFETIHERAKALWQDKLSRIEIDVARTNDTIVEMLYSSLYRSFLTPNNATGEAQGLFKGTSSPYFDSLYCTWDTVCFL
jgi:putative alpha-1,2-mannosidase